MSAIFCAGMVFEGTGTGMPMAYLLPCVCGLLLMILGSYILDVPDSDAAIASKATGGKLSLTAGFLIIVAATMLA